MDNLLDSHRPEHLHPFASAIDEPELKAPEEMVRLSFGISSFTWGF
jgi:hypothetical protein